MTVKNIVPSKNESVMYEIQIVISLVVLLVNLDSGMGTSLLIPVNVPQLTEIS